MKEIKTDSELLAEIVGWGEKIATEVAGRYVRQKPNTDAIQRGIESYTAMRAAIEDALTGGAEFTSENIIRNAKLNGPEIQVFYICLYYVLVERINPPVASLIRAVSELNSIPAAAAAVIFHPESPMFKNKILSNNCRLISSNVEVSNSIIQKVMGLRVKTKAAVKPVNQKINPKQIYKKLSYSVIGQEEAKKQVASSVFRHIKACQLNQKREPRERIQKANILIIGPTGTGKTHIARSLATILNAPFSVCDATQYTESGYVGMNVEDMLVQLLKAANNCQERMQNGIIYIDEIDKIAARDSRSGHNTSKDVSGLSVQQELLKLLDGDKINYSKRGGFSENEYEFNVGGILFIAGGAFMGLEEIVKARLSQKAVIGFSGSLEAARMEALKNGNWLKHICMEDLVKYGFIPEFLGRFASMVTLDPLSLVDIRDILTKPRNSLLSQYTEILKAAGVKHRFTAEELKSVAEEAFSLKTGARGLKAIMEARMSPLLFEGGQAEKLATKKPHSAEHSPGKAA